MSGRLKDKVAIITGGTSGIGRRTVELFAEEGASVLVAARRERDGRELADRLGDKVEFLKTDVSIESDVKRMIDYAVDRFGQRPPVVSHQFNQKITNMRCRCCSVEYFSA
jgi:NAD(P)-dependent dehydrogenase (short-subunit alcohol dehydrogenase family)